MAQGSLREYMVLLMEQEEAGSSEGRDRLYHHIVYRRYNSQ